MRWRLTLLALLIAAPLLAQSPGNSEWADDEAVLAAGRLPTKGPELLSILRMRIPKADSIDTFRKHVVRLNAAGYAERARATADLIKMGPVVRPLLENLLRDSKADAETVGRLRVVLDKFPADKDDAIVTAAARLLQRDKPTDSLPTLLDFVPYATNELVREEVQRAIDIIAQSEKKSASLRQAVESSNPARRAAAAEALIRLAGMKANDPLEALLKDPHPLVRYQVGMALVAKHDKRGLPLLIQALADSTPERIDNALELLYRAAGDNAPTLAFEGKKNIAKFQAAWQQWLTKEHAGLDLAKVLAKNEQAFTIVSTGLGGKGNAQNRVYELAPDHTTIRWEFQGTRYPLDLQILGANRLLIAEYLDRRITERDFKGNILWQVPAVMPIACQRLPNGHTFIAMRQKLQIVDRDGQEVFTWATQNPSITTGRRLRNGQMVVVSSGGLCQLLDPTGAELKRFQLGQPYTLGGNIEVLPNGRILAPLYSANCVAEFDWNGNKLWQAPITRPVSVTRLSNGHTLVVCSVGENRVMEIDRDGREVWSHRTEGRPFRARPR